MTVLDSPLCSMTYMCISSTRHDFSSFEQALISIIQLLATSKVCVPMLYPQGYHVTMVIAVHWHQYWVGLIADCFLHLKSFIATSDAMKTSLQEGVFQVRSGLIPWNPISRACNVLSNRDLLSTFDRQSSSCLTRLLNSPWPRNRKGVSENVHACVHACVCAVWCFLKIMLFMTQKSSMLFFKLATLYFFFNTSSMHSILVF